MKIEDLRGLGLVYLGTPYRKYPSAHGIYSGIEAAFIDAAQLMGNILKRGVLNFYSPIVHCHPIAKYTPGLNPTNNDLWIAFHDVIIGKSDALAVAMMRTWQVSDGLKKEIEAFELAGKPIYYLNPETLEINIRLSSNPLPASPLRYGTA